MKRFPGLSAIILIVVAALTLSGMAQAAEEVGRFTQVEGRVDVLRGGKLPATPVKVQDKVQSGDVVRTKSLSKAQITFVDDTILTISPESRIAIDQYVFDPAKGKRDAVLQVFQGMALAVVSKIFKVEKPDFVVKTHTAVMGVRGTEAGVRIQPNASTFMDFSGKVCVDNIYPEIKGQVCLNPMEGTVVERGLPPTLPFEITPGEREMFMRQLGAGPQSAKVCSPAPAPAMASTCAPASTTAQPTPGVTTPGEFNITVIKSIITIPPTITTTTETFNFSQVFQGLYQKTSVSPYSVATYYSASPGSGNRTGVYPGSFTSNFAITATAPNPNTFSPYSSGNITSTSSGVVSGVPGGVLTGTMTMNANTTGGTIFSFAGPVTLQPTGALNFQTTGTFTMGSVTGTTTGTWNQTPK